MTPTESAPAAPESAATIALAGLHAAVKTWHESVQRFKPESAGAAPGAQVMCEMLEERIGSAARVYGDARVLEAGEAGMVPLGWVGEAMENALARYLKTCSSGGMPRKQAEMVRANLQEMLRLGYLERELAQRMVDARGSALEHPGGLG